MKFSATILLAAALGVSAHPSGHAHKNAHRSLDARGKFVMAAKPSIPEPEPTTVAPPPPPPTTTVAPPKPKPTQPKAVPDVAETSESSEDDVSAAGFKPFCGGKKIKRATLDEIAYTGNVGTAGNYGCNVMAINSAAANKYQNTATFKNVAGSDQVCSCWLKIGPTGGINGFFSGNQALDFDLPKGTSKVIAFDKDTQGGCACGAGSVPLTTNGQFAATWFEVDCGNKSNGGWGGADASSIVSAAEGLPIPGMRVCGHGTCSTIFPGGKGENAFVGGTEAEDGIGLNIAPGKIRLTVEVGYKG